MKNFNKNEPSFTSKMSKVLFIDCYDSFSKTIIYYLKELKADIKVLSYEDLRQDKSFKSAEFSHIVLSPGPNAPQDYALLFEILNKFKDKKILGICLGHQLIALFYKSQIARLKHPRHAKLAQINFAPNALFKGIKNTFKATLYNSLYVKTLSNELEALAYDEKGVLMALKHKNLDIYGIQFHPEAVMSEYGKKILKNFLKIDEVKNERE